MEKVDFPIKRIIASRRSRLSDGVVERYYLIEWSPGWVPVEGLGSFIFNQLKHEFTSKRGRLEEPKNAAKYPVWRHVSPRGLFVCAFLSFELHLSVFMFIFLESEATGSRQDHLEARNVKQHTIPSQMEAAVGERDRS
jgi:hypothetical protein